MSVVGARSFPCWGFLWWRPWTWAWGLLVGAHWRGRPLWWAIVGACLAWRQGGFGAGFAPLVGKQSYLYSNHRQLSSTWLQQGIASAGEWNASPFWCSDQNISCKMGQYSSTMVADAPATCVARPSTTLVSNVLVASIRHSVFRFYG